MTVDEMQRRMSQREYETWAILLQVEAAEDRAAAKQGSKPKKKGR